MRKLPKYGELADDALVSAEDFQAVVRGLETQLTLQQETTEKLVQELEHVIQVAMSGKDDGWRSETMALASVRVLGAELQRLRKTKGKKRK